MPWPRFLAGNVVGAVCWGPVLLLAGYYATDLPVNGQIGRWGVAGIAVATSAWGVIQWRRREPRPAPKPPTWVDR